MSDVFPALVDAAIEKVNDLQSVYSTCVMLWFRQTGKLDIGFDNKKMVAWIKENRQGIFGENGKKLSTPKKDGEG